MNELALKAFPWILSGLLALSSAGCLYLYVSESREFSEYKGKIEGAMEAQAAALKEESDRREENLVQIRKSYEDKVPAVRDAAVRAYRLRYPNTCSCGIEQDASGKPLDDGAVKECLADNEFIRDAAEDVTKLGAFQEYCKRNNCPVTE